MKKFLTSSIVASALFATAGLADISTTGTGEFLVAPQYFANSGFSTELKLVNTSPRYSYIYRAVVREYASSNEFDFIILLSPLDVWTGTLSAGQGGYYINSNDDSNYGNQKLSVNITEFTKDRPAGQVARTFEKGYVEFYPIAAYDEGAARDNEATMKNVKAVDKATLSARFKQLEAGNNSGAILVQNAAENAFVSGYATIKKNDFKAAMTLPMTAFNGVVQTTTVQTGDVVKASKNTQPDKYLGVSGIAQVMEDLKVTSVTVPYEKYGENNAVYFTFWGDFAGTDKEPGYQKRTFDFLVRDTEEFGITPEVPQDPIYSGGHTTVTPPSKGEVKDEMGSVWVKGLLQKDGIDTDTRFETGMTKIFDFKNTDSTNQKIRDTFTHPRALVTYMSATYVDGAPSFSWVYAPVKR